MNEVNKLAKAMALSAESRDKKKTSPYDTTARVLKVEGNTAWVSIPGGVEQTPAMMAVNAKVGDDVRVRVAGGKAYVMGNTTAPPTDDALAKAAQGNAIRAAAAAEKASVSAETAHTAANNALRDAATAQESADIAQTAANNAVEDAARAHAEADAAKADATIAKDAADTAKESADQALWGLSTVEDVVGTLNWITAHGTMTLTSDTVINPAHVYFVVDAEGDYEVGGTHYSIVTEPKEEDLSIYYELTVDESLQNYVGTHLALTNEGLSVISTSQGWRVVIAAGGGTQFPTAGVYLVDPQGNIAQQTNANGVAFNTGKPVTIGDSTASIIFDGNGHINMIGANVTIGGANNVNGTLTILDASGQPIGSWDKNGINATNATLNNASISGSVSTVSGDYKITLDSASLKGYHLNAEISKLSMSQETYDLSAIISELPSAIQQYYTETEVAATYLDVAVESQASFMHEPVGELRLTVGAQGRGIIISDVREYFYLNFGGLIFDTARWTNPTLTFNGNSVFTDTVRIQRSTNAYPTFDSGNPQIQFCNTDASQNLALVFTDYDSYQEPASLTLVGNQGGEYFIAPNIKASDGTRSITLQIDSDGGKAGLWDNNYGNYMMYGSTGDTWIYLNKGDIYSSGVYCGTKILRTDGTLRAGTGSTQWTDITPGFVQAYNTSGEAQITARNTSGNRIYLYATASGTAGIYSFGANGSGYGILSRDNNSNTINTSGSWLFNSDIYLVNNRFYYGRNTGGTARLLCGINNNNDYFFGFGSYSNSEGRTWFDGNEVHVRSKGLIYLEALINSTKTYNNTAANAPNMFISSAGTVARSTSSSKRYKHDIKTLTDYNKILEIPVVSFKYNTDYLGKEDRRYDTDIPGFIAEDVYKAYPIAADFNEDGNVEDWNVRMIVPPILAVIKDLKKQVQELSEKIERMKAS